MSHAARLLAGGIAGLGWASLVERRWFRLRHATVPALGAAGALRILHVSDLHLVPGQERKLAFVRGLAAVGADLVVATGDLLGDDGAVAPVVSALGTLSAQGRPAVAVLGSNDVWAPEPKNPLRYLRGPAAVRPGRRLDVAGLVTGLAGAGWEVLANDARTVEVRDTTVAVAGLGDPHVGWDRPAEALAGGWGLRADLRLGVVHAPYRRCLDAFAGAGADLVLAGHTHGGQLRVPGVGALVTNCDLPRRQARGLSRWAATWLHVSAGLGESRYAPVRFACPPEATVIDVVPGPGVPEVPGAVTVPRRPDGLGAP